MAVEFVFDLSVDREHLHDVVKGLMCTIFFYRTFGLVVPKRCEFLEVSYPFVDEPELEDIIESKIDTILTKVDQDNDTPILSSSSSTPLGSPPNLKFTNPSTNNNPYQNLRFAEQTIDEEPEDSRANSATTTTNTPNNQDNSIHSSLRSPSLRATTGTSQNNVKLLNIIIKFYEVKKLKKPTWFGKIEEEVNFESWILNIKVLNRSPYDQTEQEKFIKVLQSNFEDLVWKISDTANNNKEHIPIITSVSLLPFNYTISIKKAQNNESWKEFISKMLKEPII